MFAETLINYASLFSSYDLKKKDKIILSYFKKGSFKQSDTI